MELYESNLRELILNLRQPHVIRNMKLPWKCFDITFDEWCKMHDAENTGKMVTEFEFASRKYLDSPQWERLRNTTPLKFKDFYDKIVSTEKDDMLNENWICFNYKNVEGLPNGCKNGVSFKPFGFTDVDDDITYWLGSDGAHTPCHYDTYGCNIVVQVYGRKMWLLFPPSANLTPIRVPYEESSVYCSEVFYSPKDLTKVESLSEDCYKCILEPGDILIVPNKWWHYVENLSPALSFNSWIPLEKDHETTLDECIVKFIVEPMAKNSQDDSGDAKIEILNPNEDIVGEGIILHLLEHLTEDMIIKNEQLSKKFKTKHYPYQYLTESDTENLIKTMNEKFENEVVIKSVENIPKEAFFKILNENSKRFDKACGGIENNSSGSIKEILINSLCDPKIISIIRENFMSRYIKYKLSIKDKNMD